MPEERKITCEDLPMSTRARVMISLMVVALIAVVCVAAFRPHPIYRIKWNEMTSTAIIEQYTNVGNGHLGWKRARYLGNFKSLEDANKQLDRIMEQVNKDRAEEASWKIVREEE